MLSPKRTKFRKAHKGRIHGTAKGGTWFHHHQHCHKADAAGKMIDLKDGKDEKTCTDKGGTWTDHGHGEEGKPAATK